MAGRTAAVAAHQRRKSHVGHISSRGWSQGGVRVRRAQKEWKTNREGKEE